MPGREQENELLYFKRENRRLRRRINELEAEFAISKIGKYVPSEQGGIYRSWYGKIKEKALMSSKNYFAYLINALKGTSLFSVFNRVLLFFRRFRLFSGIVKFVSILFLLAQTSVVFLVFISALLVIIPIAVVFSLVVLTASFVKSRRTNKILARIIKGKRVCVFFAEKEQMQESRYFVGTVRDFSLKGYVCMVISPFFFSKKGLGGKGRYVTGRREYENVYMIRRNYFFILRKALLDKKGLAKRVTYIY